MHENTGDALNRDLDPVTEPFGGVDSTRIEPFDSTPAAPAPASSAAFGGRTPDRTSAIRAGIVLGAALVVALGTAVVMGASPDPGASTSNAGADPSAAAAQPSKDPDKAGDQGASRGFGPFGVFAPFSAGKGNGAGRGDRFGGVGSGKITVTAVSGSKVSLATSDGWTRTITVPSDAKITKGGEPATIADVSVGDTVRFGQKKNDDGTYTITALAIVLPRAAGSVTAVDANSFTIKVRGNTTETINTNSSTKYHLDNADGSRSDLKVGSVVSVTGEQANTGNMTATSVTIILPRVGGTVDSVSGNTITVLRRDGTKLTVHVGSATTIGVGGVDKATVSDVKAGMVIVVKGTQRTDGSLDATAVRAGQPRAKGDHPDKPKVQSNGSPAPSGSTG